MNGARMEVEYNRDSDKAYGALLKAVTSGSSTVETFVDASDYALLIVISCYETSSESSLSLYVDGKEVYQASDHHETKVFGYGQRPSSAYIVANNGDEAGSGHIMIGTSPEDLGDWSHSTGSTFDLLSLNSQTVYIQHDHFD